MFHSISVPKFRSTPNSSKWSSLPRLKCYTFPALIPKSKKTAEAGLVELSPGLNILSCNRAFDFDRVLYYGQG